MAVNRRLASSVAEDKFYNELWEADRQKKIQREEREAVERQQKREVTVSTLNQQLEELNRRREEEHQLKLQEQELLKQRFELEEMAEQMKATVRKNNLAKARLELDEMNKEQKKRRLDAQ